MKKLSWVALTAIAVTSFAAERQPSDIARVIESYKNDIARIYNTYLDAGLTFEGTVVVRFTVARSGTVTESIVAESTTGCKLFDEAVADAVKSWAFGPADGDPVTVRYPFTFTLPLAPPPNGGEGSDAPNAASPTKDCPPHTPNTTQP